MPLHLIPMLVLLVDKTPEDNDVVAGPWGAVIVVALIVATALLLWSFVIQLRKVRAANLPSKHDEE